jgi:hypothetical protein
MIVTDTSTMRFMRGAAKVHMRNSEKRKPRRRQAAMTISLNPLRSTKKSCSASVVPKAPKSRDLIKG